MMVDDFDEEFLFDYDLFLEGQLSQDDAWAMYRRGEITQDELIDYLRYKANQEEQPEKMPRLVVVALIVLSILFLFSCIAGIGQ